MKKAIKIRKQMTKIEGFSSSAFFENKIIKFEDFKMNELQSDPDDQSSEAIEFLYKLKDDDISDYLHYFLTIRNKEEKKEYIDDIMHRLASSDFKNISPEVKSWVEHHLKKRTL